MEIATNAPKIARAIWGRIKSGNSGAEELARLALALRELFDDYELSWADLGVADKEGERLLKKRAAAHIADCAKLASGLPRFAARAWHLSEELQKAASLSADDPILVKALAGKPLPNPPEGLKEFIPEYTGKI